MIDRRTLIASGLAASLFPALSFAGAPGDRRFVFIVLRGAMDGVGTVIPYAEPSYTALRRQLADPGGDGEARKLDGSFALHPALAETAKLYGAGEALFVHAVATPYRERSHFDGQNLLETGGARAYARQQGWLNRLIQAAKPEPRAVAIAATVPPVLRGEAAVASYAPSRLPGASDEMLRRVSAMYEDDALLHRLWSEAMAARMLAGEEASGARAGLPELAGLAAKFLAEKAGPRIAVLEHDGWDTHAGQPGRLARQLRQLDMALAALKSGLGPAWGETVVLAATEFGRTVAANGTGGTDHGTASAAILAGGRVEGGRVVADWPGLAAASLHEGRDLRPTADLNALILAAAGAQFGGDPEALRPLLFPDFPKLRPMVGLIEGV